MTLLISLALGFLVAPLVAEAQPAGKVFRIGVLSPTQPRSAPYYKDALFPELRKLATLRERTSSLSTETRRGSTIGSPPSRPSWSV